MSTIRTGRHLSIIYFTTANCITFSHGQCIRQHLKVSISLVNLGQYAVWSDSVLKLGDNPLSMQWVDMCCDFNVNTCVDMY